jgi:hypothetical protein
MRYDAEIEGSGAKIEWQVAKMALKAKPSSAESRSSRGDCKRVKRR